MDSKAPSSAPGEAPGLRLNKAIAASGLASRRAADELIRAGRVTLNGRTAAEPGIRIAPASDVIAVDGRVLSFAAAETKIYLMCNKPVQVVSTASDPQGRKTVLDLLPPEYAAKRLYPVGRLDYFSEGLLLLTNDGDLTLRLTHPRHHLPRVYRLTLRERPTDGMLETMRKGMTLAEGEQLAPIQVERLDQDGKALEMTLSQGVNRQIRRMCRDLNLVILRLARVASGPLRLGELPPGGVRELSPEELGALKRAVGM